MYLIMSKDCVRWEVCDVTQPEDGKIGVDYNGEMIDDNDGIKKIEDTLPEDTLPEITDEERLTIVKEAVQLLNNQSDESERLNLHDFKNWRLIITKGLTSRYLKRAVGILTATNNAIAASMKQSA